MPPQAWGPKTNLGGPKIIVNAAPHLRVVRQRERWLSLSRAQYVLYLHRRLVLLAAPPRAHRGEGETSGGHSGVSTSHRLRLPSTFSVSTSVYLVIAGVTFHCSSCTRERIKKPATHKTTPAPSSPYFHYYYCCYFYSSAYSYSSSYSYYSLPVLLHYYYYCVLRPLPLPLLLLLLLPHRLRRSSYTVSTNNVTSLYNRLNREPRYLFKFPEASRKSVSTHKGVKKNGRCIKPSPWRTPT